MQDNLGAGKKILFANFPADGHFNPLTGLAVHLVSIGYEVRWYSSAKYADKLHRMQIEHYPFRNAIDVADGNFDAVFPGRAAKRSQIARLTFDLINAFILRGPEYYSDIKEIYREYPFDLLIADCAFTGIPFIKDLMKVPVVSIGVFPLTETSIDCPPSGLGMEPASGRVGKIKQALMRKVASRLIFGEPNRVMYKQFDRYRIPHNGESLFDMMIRKSDLLLQSGTPGFEYFRSDLSDNIRFVGALLPYTRTPRSGRWYDERLDQYRRVILVTQGTVEKDVNKILIPTLEAFKDSGTLVVVTTGGSGTDLLRRQYVYPNVIIEDYIPFSEIMPYASVYITNGGYGGVMLGIRNKLPMVVAGVHEGKNEICARVGYFRLGVNLRTETPSPQQISRAVEKVIADPVYRERVKELAAEFSKFDPEERCARYIGRLLRSGSFFVTGCDNC